MTVVCPYCRHRMRVKGAHPGRFRPRCDRCGGAFFLVLSPEPEMPPMVTPIESERQQRELQDSRAG